MFTTEIPINREIVEKFFLKNDIVSHPFYCGIAPKTLLDDEFKNSLMTSSLAKNKNKVKDYFDYVIEVMKFRQKSYKKDLKSKDYWKVLFAIEKPYRLDWLKENFDLLKDNQDKYYELLKEAYIQTEFPMQNKTEDEITDLFTVYENPHIMMNSDELERFKKLPKVIKIYRGVRVKKNEKLNLDNLGISYTLDEERAKWFAKRLQCDGDKPILLSAEIRKKDIFSLFLDRGEDEIVVNPNLIRNLLVVNLDEDTLDRKRKLANEMIIKMNEK